MRAVVYEKKPYTCIASSNIIVIRLPPSLSERNAPASYFRIVTASVLPVPTEIKTVFNPVPEIVPAGSSEISLWLKYQNIRKTQLGDIADVFRGKAINRRDKSGSIAVVNITNLLEYDIDFPFPK